MDKITVREFETFTAHDNRHALKVAHLMWNILKPSRRNELTPPEIALLLLSAYLHDLGMGLTREEREARLAEASDIWQRLDINSGLVTALDRLRQHVAQASQAEARAAARSLQQAEEALLCIDGRERHATRERYEELLCRFRRYHEASDQRRLPDPDDCMVFAGDSFREDLIEVCISHNQPAYSLLERDPKNPDQQRFPNDAPLGPCLADSRMVAAALRLSDILDFDRERTPEVLYHYLLPHDHACDDNVSVREWHKHLSIANWSIEDGVVEYKAIFHDPVIEHAVREFVSDIREELQNTRTAIETSNDWPFELQGAVKVAIRAIGYRYVPYKFIFDQDRIYHLLMGGQIYDTNLAAIRELVQNSVDACRLRDALSLRDDTTVTPNPHGRILVVHAEHPTGATLTVRDTGVGMDQRVIEEYLLNVGASYYKSAAFARLMGTLRSKNLDFVPVSEFGIGFLSCFMLADRIVVTTTPWVGSSKEHRTRVLEFDGIGRLVHVQERPQSSGEAGTTVKLFLRRSGKDTTPTYEEIRTYLASVCQRLPYLLHLRAENASGLLEEETVGPVPAALEVAREEATVTVNVTEPQVRGQIIVFRTEESRREMAAQAEAAPVVERNQVFEARSDALLRGGFRISNVPGLPQPYLHGRSTFARLEVEPVQADRRVWNTNLARTKSSGLEQITRCVQHAWLSQLIENRHENGLIGDFQCASGIYADARLERFGALAIYEFARLQWAKNRMLTSKIELWEACQSDEINLGWPTSLMHHALLQWILPRVCSLRYGDQGKLYYGRLRNNWREELRGWHTYITEPIRWSEFVDYRPEIDKYLYWRYANERCLNAQFKDELSASGFEADDFLSVFNAVIHAKRFERQADLSAKGKRLLRWAGGRLPDAVIGDMHGSWRLDDLFGAA